MPIHTIDDELKIIFESSEFLKPLSHDALGGCVLLAVKQKAITNIGTEIPLGQVHLYTGEV